MRTTVVKGIGPYNSFGGKKKVLQKNVFSVSCQKPSRVMVKDVTWLSGFTLNLQN